MNTNEAAEGEPRMTRIFGECKNWVAHESLEHTRNNSTSVLQKSQISLPCRSVVSVNGADGISDVEGKAARVAASETGNERVSNPWLLFIRGHFRQLRWEEAFLFFLVQRQTIFHPQIPLVPILKLAHFRARSPLPSRLCLLCRCSHQLHSQISVKRSA
jgi:hypothetical protein